MKQIFEVAAAMLASLGGGTAILLVCQIDWVKYGQVEF